MAKMDENLAAALAGPIETEYRVVSYSNGRLELVRASGPIQTLPIGSQVIVRKA